MMIEIIILRHKIYKNIMHGNIIFILKKYSIFARSILLYFWILRQSYVVQASLQLHYVP